MLSIVTRVFATVLCLSVVVPAEAALLGRLPATPGGTDYQAAYDDVLDITWVTDAALSGSDTWEYQRDWASDLDYLGFKDWRLASMKVLAGVPTGTAGSVVNCSTASEEDCRDNELGYMYRHNLADIPGNDKRGTHTVDGVTLTGIQTEYWSGTQHVESNVAWFFRFDLGGEVSDGTFHDRYGWAVRPGDVPLPGAVVLMGTALVGLLGFGRRKLKAKL